MRTKMKRNYRPITPGIKEMTDTANPMLYEVFNVGSKTFMLYAASGVDTAEDARLARKWLTHTYEGCKVVTQWSGKEPESDNDTTAADDYLDYLSDQW